MSHLLTTSIRILLGIIGLAGIVVGPWFLTPLCIILLSLRFRAWEAILLGLIMDLTYEPSNGYLYGIPLFTLGAICVIWVFEPLRRELLLS